MRAYVGADWSATEVVCAVAGEDGEPLALRRGAIPTVESVQRLVAEARERVDADEVFVMIEAGSKGWVRLFAECATSVFVVDPKQARRFAESMGSSGAKDDRRDASSLSRMCRSREHRASPWLADDSIVEQLDAYSALNEQVTKDLSRTKQRLRNTLRDQMPLVDQALPRDLCTRWVERLLRRVPTAWHAGTLSRSELDELLRSAKVATRDRVWNALQQTKAPWLTEAVAMATAMSIGLNLDQMVLLRDQQAAVEKTIDALTAPLQSRQIVESMGGIGLKLSTALLCFAFRSGTAQDRDAAGILMGASPVFRGSAKVSRGRARGKPKGKTRMRRATSPRARRASFLLGRQAAQRLCWAKAMSADGVSRGQSKGTIYRRIARSVLRIVSAMLRTGERYDEARYIAALKANGVPWAAGLP